MKKIIALLAFTASACGDAAKQNHDEDHVVLDKGEVKATAPDTSYYLRTAGLQQQDTEAIKFIITGATVEGKMMYLPYEKDWRIGNITGTKEGDYVNLMWTFIQEGVKDSAQVVFKMERNHLIQQSYSSDADTGENLVDTVSVQKTFRQIEKSNFPKHDFDMGIL